MKKTIAAAIAALAIAFGTTACEGGSSAPSDDGINGVIFVPIQGNPVGVPIFF